MTKFYDIGADGNYRVPMSPRTRATHGQRILKVGFVSGDRDVVVVAERGIARGPAAQVLPQALHRALKVGRMLPTEFQTNDKTYDTESTVDDPFKPKQDPPLHPKEEAVRQTAKESKDLHPSEEDPQIRQKLKDEQKLLPTKEKEVRVSATDNWDLDDKLRKALENCGRGMGTSQRKKFNEIKPPDDLLVQSPKFPEVVKRAMAVINKIENYLVDGLDDEFKELARIFKGN